MAASLMITKEKAYRFLSTCLQKTRCFNTAVSEESYMPFIEYYIPFSGQPFWNDENSHFDTMKWNWKQRINKLPSSTFAAALGFSPEQEQIKLWVEKYQSAPFEGNMETYTRRTSGRYAIERYKLITGNTVIMPPRFQVYGKGEDDYLAASPDGIVSDFTGKTLSRGLLKIKCPPHESLHIDLLPKPWDRIPLCMIPEAQGLMEIMDVDWMDLYVWTTRGSNLFRLYRDAEYWKALHWVLNDFWYRRVQPAKVLYDSNTKWSKLTPLAPDHAHPCYKYVRNQSQRIVDKSSLLIRSPTPGFSPGFRGNYFETVYSNLTGLEYFV